MGGAWFFEQYSRQRDTPVVVLALSIASVTYGGLLGTYLMAERWPRASGRDVITALWFTMACMLIVIFAGRLATYSPLSWLAPVGRLAWPWYVPLGTALTILVGIASSLLRPQSETIR
jgi:Mn2+/Fe2+ NRAMP family transporter